jgi:hypothetical protein
MGFKYFYTFLFLYLIALTHTLVAQPVASAWSFHASYGMIWAQNPPVKHLSSSHTYALQADYHLPLSGRKPWHKNYRYPDIGFSALFFDFQQKRLGKAYSALAFIDRHLDKKRRWTYRLGFGTALHSRYFDKNTNHTNQAIGALQSAAVQLGFLYKRRIADEWFLQCGLLLSHYSNGASKMPNSGLNLPTLSVGVRRGSREITGTHLPDSLLIKRPIHYGWEGQLAAHLGRKETYPVGGEKYMFYTLAAYAAYRRTEKSAWNFGAEGIYNNTLKFERAALYDSTYQNRDIKRLSVLAGHELYFGRISLLTQIGVYVYKKIPLNPFMYQRVGIKYYWKQNFYASANLRVHFGKADGVEWGAGLRLHSLRKKKTMALNNP